MSSSSKATLGGQEVSNAECIDMVEIVNEILGETLPHNKVPCVNMPGDK
jgi:hypothetical protein